MGTPSMTYNGSLLALIEVPPRIRTCAPDPGSPLFGMMLTPAARPWIMLSTFVTTPTLAVDASTEETDPVMASRRWLPYPVTTTASRIAAAGRRARSTLAVAPTVTVTSCISSAYPIRVARILYVPPEMSEIVKPPSERLAASRRVPSSRTITPESGSWVCASVTLPEIEPVDCCAGSWEGAAQMRPPRSTGTT